MKNFLFAALFSALLFVGSSHAATVDELVNDAVSDNKSVATASIAELRSMGTVGLDALFVKYAAEIERFKKDGVVDAEWQKIATALDSVAMQKDAYASHLFWYTDIEEAKRAADKKNRPILSLRLLGNLDEEFSCANSRLFRSILYPNAQVSQYLRDNYILHWKSVRPAPRITIDFGDGRKIERTITGNSIHYILSADGTIIEALPGLYSPTGFLTYLMEGRRVDKLAGQLLPESRARAFMKYRQLSFNQIKAKRNKVVAASGVKLTEPAISPNGGLVAPTAITAAPVAMAKMMVVDEYSLLRVYDDFAKFEASVGFDDWLKLSGYYSPIRKLDDNSISFIRRQNSKTGLSEQEFGALFAKLDSFIALDTTRNDFLYHTKLYEWLNSDRGNENLEEFNARVYADIFKTPGTDKWLGLYASDVYTALDGNGIIK
ncbi:MAG TPA: hypothetical protein PKA82_09900 [Pyrinomonadaceae bacterium]|nr:hypothetical protein [Pyrinomonadaceae bacterium]